MEHTRLVALWTCAVALACSPAAGRASVLIPPPPYAGAKEFTVIKHDGLFHVFYMQREFANEPGRYFNDLGHSTSPNLVTWTHHPPVLPTRPEHWDNWQIWAPHVIERDSVFYLFYPAVTNGPGYDLHQRIGLATSTNLFDWERLDEPIFECADVPWTYCDPSIAFGGDFRDPFVMEDPATPGEFLQYYVARDEADVDQLLVGAARSTGDLTQWSPLGPFTNFHRSRTGSYAIESPCLLLHDGLWYVFYTSWHEHPIQYQTNPDPLGAAATWALPVYLHSEVPEAVTDSWFGPEVFSAGGRDYFAAVNAPNYWIEFREIVWTTGGHFTFAEPTLGATPRREAAWGFHCAGTRPGWERVRMWIEAPRPASGRVEVLDASGRVCRTLLAGPIAAGTTRLLWDGNDARGAPVESGVYFVTFQAAGERITHKVVRLR